VPVELPYLNVKLPPSAREYYAYETGLQHTMLQLRFEIAASDLLVFEKRLPCRLGPIETTLPVHAVVGTNDRPWYRPENVKKHRSCEYHRGLRTAVFLVDLERADRLIVYAIIESE
jgi:hypothetical protein